MRSSACLSTWAGVFSATFLVPFALLVPSAGSAGPADSEAVLWAPPAAECETDSRWSSRHQALTPTDREDCVHALAGRNHKLRVSHQRRGLEASAFLEERFSEAIQPLATAPVGESESKVELAGSVGMWNYETDFDLGREARIDDGRFVPEDRSQLQFKSGLDFGLVRSRVEFKGSQTEERRLYARGFAIDPGSTSELGARGFIDVVVPHLPVLTFSAGRAEKDVFRGNRRVGEQVESDVASAALWYGGKSWQAYAVSSRFLFRDDVQRNAPEGVYEDHYVAGSWWFSNGLSLNPSLQYSEASYDGRENWIRTLRANLGVYGTGLWQNGTLTLWGGYTRDRDTAGNFEYEQFDVSVGVEHTFDDLSFLEDYEVAVGTRVGAGQYLDRIYTGASEFGMRTSFTLRVTAL